jgi:hypothetical protein
MPMDLGGLLGALGSKLGFGGAIDFATQDPMKIAAGGLIGPSGVDFANNLGAGSAGIANAMDLSQGQDIAGASMQKAADETPKPFELKDLSSQLSSLAKQREERQAEIESSLKSGMAQTMQQAGSGLMQPPQGAMMNSPMAQNAQIANAPNPSGAAQAIMGGNPAGVGIGAQPNIHEMVRRLRGM